MLSTAPPQPARYSGVKTLDWSSQIKCGGGRLVVGPRCQFRIGSRYRSFLRPGLANFQGQIHPHLPCKVERPFSERCGENLLGRAMSSY